MLAMLDYIRKLFLSAAKRYSPARLLQYLLALCRVVFKKCNFKYGDENSNHRFPLPKTPTIADGNGCLSEESIGTPVGHAISGSHPPAQPQGPMNAVGAHSAQNNDTFPSCVRNQILPFSYANGSRLQVNIDVNLPSNRVYSVCRRGGWV